ncbi:hypothetical protein CIT14_22090, partial [Virgibacillus profundi]
DRVRLLVAQAGRDQCGVQVLVRDPFRPERPAGDAPQDRRGLGEGEVGRAVDGFDPAAGPAGVQQPGGHDVADVARIDPRHRVIHRHRGTQHALAQRVRVEQQVAVEVPATQVQHRFAGLVELLLGPGETVDLT